MLHYLLAKGNTTCFEFKTGIVPERVEDYKFGLVLDLADEKSVEDDNAVNICFCSTWTLFANATFMQFFSLFCTAFEQITD